MKLRKKKDSKNSSGIFVPAGLFIGMGLGFLYSQLIAGVFLGLGMGFILMAIAHFMKS